MSKIQKIVFQNVPLQNGVVQEKVILSYQLSGQTVGSAPLVVVNHALTGNSQVLGENGWWQSLIGDDKIIGLSTLGALKWGSVNNSSSSTGAIIVPARALGDKVDGEKNTKTNFIGTGG